jgi:hypothetical protein
LRGRQLRVIEHLLQRKIRDMLLMVKTWLLSPIKITTARQTRMSGKKHLLAALLLELFV